MPDNSYSMLSKRDRSVALLKDPFRMGSNVPGHSMLWKLKYVLLRSKPYLIFLHCIMVLCQSSNIQGTKFYESSAHNVHAVAAS